MIILFCGFLCFSLIAAGPATEASYKGQYCTDPRTMRKHAAYTEWADAYSCTRHRCQPGGRNLAIYTVGCKRVEAPESAIECEEVVEDTNMQFPYCCTRLRCLVVVRGEVWTRVLGQPWETLPAAPWSHMYKMKKPPPGADGTFLPKMGEGPVYELQTEPDADPESKVLRTRKKTTDGPDCNDVVARAEAPPAPPDIVIALSTNGDKDLPDLKKDEGVRHKRGKSNTMNSYFEEDAPEQPRADDIDDGGPVTEREKSAHHQVTWTEIPQNQWNEHDPGMDIEGPSGARVNNNWEHDLPNVGVAELKKSPLASQEVRGYQQPDMSLDEKRDLDPKPGNLQALVDAIGTRMRDIESVVQKMSEKVHHGKPGADSNPGSSEKGLRLGDDDTEKLYENREKRPSPDGDHYRRFSGRRGSKYLHSSTDVTTDAPLFVEDSNLNGYFSDAGNSLLRRAMPKEPAATYMAPVESLTSRRKSPHGEEGEESDKKKKKRVHKKKRKGAHHKKHRNNKDERRRKYRLNSVELDRNAVSLEDSSVNAPVT